MYTFQIEYRDEDGDPGFKEIHAHKVQDITGDIKEFEDAGATIKSIKNKEAI